MKNLGSNNGLIICPFCRDQFGAELGFHPLRDMMEKINKKSYDLFKTKININPIMKQVKDNIIQEIYEEFYEDEESEEEDETNEMQMVIPNFLINRAILRT